MAACLNAHKRTESSPTSQTSDCKINRKDEETRMLLLLCSVGRQNAEDFHISQHSKYMRGRAFF